MTGKVMPLENIISPDLLATRLTQRYIEWDTLRQVAKNDWEEVRRYVYATDTTQTSNSSLPWKNKTTVPKLCQIRDNLFANYVATLFPKRKWLVWEPENEDAADVQKRDSIINYMSWAIEQPTFRSEIEKVIQDYIDFGNCFATVEWVDQRVEQKDKTQAGYVGPAVRRISPLDIVFNPTAENFMQTPKLVRSLISLGELKDLLERMSNDENRDTYEKLFTYLKEIRFHARQFQGDWIQKDRLYAMDGFTNFRAYLLSDMVEVLTFYGDWYDPYTDTFEKNRVITVVDRHKLINNIPNPSFFGYPPIVHSPWRRKQDNLWGMGPLANLVGMQYRMDHIENMAADVWDLVTYPVQKVKGFVEEYIWQPGEKIFVSEEGDVELVQPDVQIMQSDMKIEKLQAQMEEMAGAPKEAMGIRSPGEKTKYEVQRLENASSRMFQNKINQFSEQVLEMLLNYMLELARRNLSGATTIRVFDNDLNATTFQTLTVDDITGVGRIKPIGARHFAEQAELVQNLTALTGSNLWATVQPHFSGVVLAKMLESIFDLKDYGAVTPYIALAEQADGQRMVQALQEQLHQEMGTATGIGHDYDTDQSGNFTPPPPQTPAAPGLGLKRNPPANATPTGTLGTQ
jgi:hypothetical protein